MLGESSFDLKKSNFIERRFDYTCNIYQVKIICLKLHLNKNKEQNYSSKLHSIESHEKS